MLPVFKWFSFFSQKNSATNELSIGAYGEKKVEQYLMQHNYAILARNYRVRNGEIDIIARCKHIVIFVEVKTRTSAHFELSEIIIPSKQQAIIRTAKYYIMKHAITDVIVRFDVALVDNARTSQEKIMYIPNAFSEQE